MALSNKTQEGVMDVKPKEHVGWIEVVIESLITQYKTFSIHKGHLNCLGVNRQIRTKKIKVSWFQSGAKSDDV